MEPTFGERLTSWLEFVKLRPAALARALGVSKTAIHNWMTGAVAPGTDRIIPIVQALGIPGGVAEFFARMPSLESGAELPEPEVPEVHPGTGDITREIDMTAVLNKASTCPTCGRHGQAA